jgi:hypothetical protein
MRCVATGVFATPAYMCKKTGRAIVQSQQEKATVIARSENRVAAAKRFDYAGKVSRCQKRRVRTQSDGRGLELQGAPQDTFDTGAQVTGFLYPHTFSRDVDWKGAALGRGEHGDDSRGARDNAPHIAQHGGGEPSGRNFAERARQPCFDLPGNRGFSEDANRNRHCYCNWPPQLDPEPAVQPKQ